MKGGAIDVCDAYIKDQIGEIKAKVEGENVDYIIIQAGGKGTRLEHLTRNKPKGIVPVNNLPIVFHMFKKYPDKKYIIIGDYKNEVLEKYLEAFGGTTCISVKAQGQGTSAGLHQALEHIPAGKRFMFVWSDLILGEEVNIDETRGNVIGISRDFECRWSYKDGQFFEEPSMQHGVAGLFIFSDKEILAQAPQSGEFVRWLQGQNIGFEEMSLLDTVETGTLEAIRRISGHEGEYRCRPFNSIEVHDNILIKRPIDDQGKALAVNEVKWYSEVKKYNFDQIPIIYELNPLTMEKINGQNIYKAKLDTEQKKKVIDNLISSLEKLHGFTKEEADPYSIMDTYFYKTFTRLDKIRNLVPFALEKTININGKDYKNPFFYREKIKEDVRNQCLYTCKSFSLIHGDCTFSNTMVDDKLNVIFLDPRGYFGSTELYGDVDYDWAKLYYSIDGDYDQFNNKNFELYIEENGVRLDIATNGWKELAPYYLSQLKGVDAQKIKFLHALIWLSLTTYAWEDYDSICGAFYKGVMLMDECLKDN
ncbi:MAG: NTP transferase domain-containing protein [Lachnoanaerobaculum sp.]|nr:NTP transferase domain-containing protein [Lachnoanaerobaculum sp.]MBS5882693.1 NTP transferase domain-containing protein [Lachnoanaerobaculum sp.]